MPVKIEVVTPADLAALKKELLAELTKVRTEMLSITGTLSNSIHTLSNSTTASLDDLADEVFDQKTAILGLDERIKKLEAGAPPTTTLKPPVPTTSTPVPTTVVPTTKPPQPPTSTSLFSQMRRLGTVKLVQDFPVADVAMDFHNGFMYQVGHAQRREVVKYAMPSSWGDPNDPTSWPVIRPIETIPGWWPTDEGYANSVHVDEQGGLWAAPRVFYDMNPPPVTKLYKLGDAANPLIVPAPRQQFSGILSTPSHRLTHLAGGGYESGQGSAFGPCLVTVAGERLIAFGWNADWNARCPREPNYYPRDGQDSWVCLSPRANANGVLEGRWACDRLMGGGIELPDGYYFFALMATDAVDYAVQSETFDVDNVVKTYVYRFNKITHQLMEWAELPAFGSNAVAGQDMGPDGKVYLNERYGWQDGIYKVDSLLHMYG